MSRILILGGTAEARALALALDREGVEIVSSLAGRVARPRLPVGAVRVGGFGGSEAMAAWITGQGVTAVLDATHPFAERISDSAAHACELSGAALLRLRRPGWEQREGDNWHWVGDLSQAAAKIGEFGERVFLTTGRQGLAMFAPITSAWFLIRCVDPPTGPLPSRHTLLLDRGPYTLPGEDALFAQHGIDVLVTKDSGGELTVAKLTVARERGVPVIVVRRPPRPAAMTVTTVSDAIAWTRAQLG